MWCTSSQVHGNFVVCMPGVAITWITNKVLQPEKVIFQIIVIRKRQKSEKVAAATPRLNLIFFWRCIWIFRTQESQQYRATIWCMETYSFLCFVNCGASLWIYFSRSSVVNGFMSWTSLWQSSWQFVHIPRSTWKSSWITMCSAQRQRKIERHSNSIGIWV